MAPAPTPRCLSRNNSEFALTLNGITTCGLKRRASREAPNPHALKRARRDGVLFAWGSGVFGSLGFGPDYLGVFRRPQEHYLTRIVSVAAGGLHTLLLDDDGKVWSCGNNDNGALGRQIGSASDGCDAPDLCSDELDSTPHIIPGLECHKITSICAGDGLSAVITADGGLFIWGGIRDKTGTVVLPNGQPCCQRPTRFYSPTEVSSVACGENHMLVLLGNGELYAWGVNDHFQLGNEPHEVNVIGPPVRVSFPHSPRVVYVAAGGMHSFAIDVVGDVWSWGANPRGQTGIDIGENGQGETINSPRRVSTMCKGGSILADSRVVNIACGEFHSLFLLNDGRVFACGGFDSGQLGLAPEHILKSVNKIHHPRVLTGIATPREVQFPFPSRNRERIIGINADSRRSMAWTNSHLFAWGMGNVGELGLGDVEEVFLPTLVDLNGQKPVQVSCGGLHTLALCHKY